MKAKVTYQACAEGCRHRCAVCRMGLVTHLACDPLCEVRGSGGSES